MEYTDLKLTQEGTVLTITVDRPEVLNAQSRIMREELDHAFDNARNDDSVKVVIISKFTLSSDFVCASSVCCCS